MSTLKAKTIQPVGDSDTLVLRTGGSDSLTLDTSGNSTIRGTLTVDSITIRQGGGANGIGVGVGALGNSTTGVWNTAFGRSALTNSTSGYYNTAVGGQALYTTNEGFENTAVGLNAGYNISDGDYNTAIGSRAGPSNGILNKTTCVGRLAVASAENSVALGFNASATEANSIYLGDSAVNKLFMGNGSAVAPAYIARAWAIIDGVDGSPALRASGSGNCSSVTDNNPGDYTLNFTTAMVDTNYAVLISNIAYTAGVNLTVHAKLAAASTSTPALKTATAVRIVITNNQYYYDQNDLSVVIFR
jgi:hypothetical protein